MTVHNLAKPPAYDLGLEYANPDIDEVSAFLADHSFLTPILRDIAQEASSYFPGAALSLSTSRDPNKVDADQLAVYIHTALAPRDALAQLHEFDLRWWLDHQQSARSLISVDVAPA